MGILESLTDDQLALLGCVVAFFGFGGLMALSHYIGNAGRATAGREPRRLPAVSETHAPAASQMESGADNNRKAA